MFWVGLMIGLLAGGALGAFVMDLVSLRKRERFARSVIEAEQWTSDATWEEEHG